jgi:hypothetical protein
MNNLEGRMATHKIKKPIFSILSGIDSYINHGPTDQDPCSCTYLQGIECVQLAVKSRAVIKCPHVGTPKPVHKTPGDFISIVSMEGHDSAEITNDHRVDRLFQ